MFIVFALLVVVWIAFLTFLVQLAGTMLDRAQGKERSPMRRPHAIPMLFGLAISGGVAIAGGFAGLANTRLGFAIGLTSFVLATLWVDRLWYPAESMNSPQA